MHSFPYDDNVKRKWTQFARKRRPGFKPSVHFSKDCFTRRTDLLGPQNVSGAISKSTRLVKRLIPTIDIAGQIKTDTPDLTPRDKRIIKRQMSSCELYSASC